MHGEGVSEVQLGIETLEFWMTVLVCQSLVVEPSTTPGGKSVYQVVYCCCIWWIVVVYMGFCGWCFVDVCMLVLQCHIE